MILGSILEQAKLRHMDKSKSYKKMILGSVQTKPKERVLNQSQMQKNETLGQVQEPTKKWFWDRCVTYHDVLIPTFRKRRLWDKSQL